ncbi:hypothetical protein K438DRAFT_1774514 [Mycena galopus ATCC 62051]|nr:hypothetical protein K438DRAFT_1774514 [Mycena galopus ATCC 62051]
MPPKAPKKAAIPVRAKAPPKKLSELEKLIAKTCSMRKMKKKVNPARSAPASDSFGEDDALGLKGLLGIYLVNLIFPSLITVQVLITSKPKTILRSRMLVPPHIEAEDDTEKSDAGSTNDDEEEDDNSEDEPEDSEASKTLKKAAGHRRTGSATRVTQSTFSPVFARLANAGSCHSLSSHRSDLKVLLPLQPIHVPNLMPGLFYTILKVYCPLATP